jgi:hypothetical protein
MGMRMKSLLSSIALSCLLVGAVGGGPARAQNSQQTLMKTCNTSAGTQNLSGDARKSFMSDCLSGKTPVAAPAAPMTQQEKMKACNVQANDQTLKGDARKTFMSTCLKG